MSSGLVWYGETVKLRIGQVAGARVNAAGRVLRDYIRVKLSRSQPVRRRVSEKGVTKVGLDPSRPGEYPKKVTAHLRNTVQSEYDPSRKVARVGTNTKYGKYLELGTRKMARRPWLSRAVRESRGLIQRVLSGGTA